MQLLKDLKKDPTNNDILYSYLEVTIFNYYLIINHPKNKNRGSNSKYKNIVTEREIESFKESINFLSILFTDDKYKSKLHNSLDRILN
jgi:hypothetical protein